MTRVDSTPDVALENVHRCQHACPGLMAVCNRITLESSAAGEEPISRSTIVFFQKKPHRHHTMSMIHLRARWY